jgi:hypothetical protein
MSAKKLHNDKYLKTGQNKNLAFTSAVWKLRNTLISEKPSVQTEKEKNTQNCDKLQF